MLGSALLLALAGLWWWGWRRAVQRGELIAACTHEIEYVSLYDEGVWWIESCRKCPFQRPVCDEDLLERLRRG